MLIHSLIRDQRILYKCKSYPVRSLGRLFSHLCKLIFIDSCQLCFFSARCLTQKVQTALPELWPPASHWGLSILLALRMSSTIQDWQAKYSARKTLHDLTDLPRRLHLTVAFHFFRSRLFLSPQVCTHLSIWLNCFSSTCVHGHALLLLIQVFQLSSRILRESSLG